MKAAVIVFAALLGAAQFLLLAALLKTVLGGNMRKTAIFLGAKFAMYAAALALLLTLFRAHLVQAGIGFACGIPVATLVYFILQALKKKKAPVIKGDDAVDGSSDN